MLSKIRAIWRSEPAVAMGAIQALVAACVGVLAAFDLTTLSIEQLAALQGALFAVLAVLASVITRSQVTPVSKIPDV